MGGWGAGSREMLLFMFYLFVSLEQEQKKKKTLRQNGYIKRENFERPNLPPPLLTLS